MNTYKIVIIGDAQTGKTSYLRRLLTGEYTKKYTPTLGVDVHPLIFHTNHGTITFNVWDVAGNEKFRGLGDGYYIGAKGALSFHTHGSNMTHERELSRMGKIPTVRVWNKVDKYNTPSLQVDVCISARNCVNLNEPFLILARQLTGHHDLVFLPFTELITPPTV